MVKRNLKKAAASLEPNGTFRVIGVAKLDGPIESMTKTQKRAIVADLVASVRDELLYYFDLD